MTEEEKQTANQTEEKVSERTMSSQSSRRQEGWLSLNCGNRKRALKNPGSRRMKERDKQSSRQAKQRAKRGSAKLSYPPVGSTERSDGRRPSRPRVPPCLGSGPTRYLGGRGRRDYVAGEFHRRGWMFRGLISATYTRIVLPA
ncbi:uncharacterized protein CIMG_10770 [Coccidioides immitis RS]|uniref:Uncharacterized protein n=3 Tax=Coccidioides immitis TaxID=5501 RepID=A0A0D8JS42_COCIM|nr:uncharacterized protein CIMG_10770 [Coccidioides immitis RS]KJF60145.1 hypothetical protein CIMG_10770 [Coccidioides immitis RS]KMP01511.1 hypothetical protein CIRG_01650 [Coccidioides immitis RMSCC 2394]KMU88950.1 hypothetical protein CIHG_06751 [Coccidioides immitis H538.4]